MAQRLKSWESPRREGRNSKGKGGAARARQLKKQQQILRKKLQGETQDNNQGKRRDVLFPFCLGLPAVLRDLQRDILQNVEIEPALTLRGVALSK